MCSTWLSIGYPVEGIATRRTQRTFHFGGDHSALCEWVAKIPMFVNGLFGFVEGFILKGDPHVDGQTDHGGTWHCDQFSNTPNDDRGLRLVPLHLGHAW